MQMHFANALGPSGLIAILSIWWYLIIIDDKFCQLEADLKFWPQIKEAFMLPECKKAKISHTFLIEEI